MLREPSHLLQRGGPGNACVWGAGHHLAPLPPSDPGASRGSQRGRWPSCRRQGGPGRVSVYLPARGCAGRTQAPSPLAISIPPRCGPTEPFGPLWPGALPLAGPGRPHGAAYCRQVSLFLTPSWNPVSQVHTCAGGGCSQAVGAPLRAPAQPRPLEAAADGSRPALVEHGHCVSLSHGLVGTGRCCAPREQAVSSWERVDALTRGGCRRPARPGRCWRGLRVAQRRVSVAFSGSAGSGVSVLTWLQVVGTVSGALTQQPTGQPFAHELKDSLYH